MYNYEGLPAKRLIDCSRRWSIRHSLSGLLLHSVKQSRCVAPCLSRHTTQPWIQLISYSWLFTPTSSILVGLRGWHLPWVGSHTMTLLAGSSGCHRQWPASGIAILNFLTPWGDVSGLVDLNKWKKARKSWTYKHYSHVKTFKSNTSCWIKKQGYIESCGIFG